MKKTAVSRARNMVAQAILHRRWGPKPALSTPYSQSDLLLGKPLSSFRQVLVALRTGVLIGAVYFGLQVICGSNIIVNLLFSVAVVMGTAAVMLGGGLRSMIGLLNFSLLAKYLLISLAMKAVLGQPSESNLAAPTTTPIVLCLGFCGIFLATLATQCYFPVRRPLCLPVVEPRQLLALFWLCFGIGNVATLIIDYTQLGTGTAADGVRIGGMMGLSRYVQPLRDISIGIALLYAHFTKSRRLVTHPLVLLAATVALALSLQHNSKGLLMAPLFYACLALFLVRGARQLRLLVLIGVSGLLLAQIVFPVIQYVRNHELVEERYALYLPLFWKSIVDAEFRDELRWEARSTYLENRYLGPNSGIIARFALIGNADNLIAPTEARNEFTGWLTILWGVKMLPPRFIYRSKPTDDASLSLSIISGMADPSSEGVSFAYGFMAGMYNAFGLLGASVGSFALLAVFYLFANMHFGNPTGANIWCVYVVGWWHSGLCEYSISGIIAGLWYAPIALIVYWASVRLAPFFPKG